MARHLALAPSLCRSGRRLRYDHAAARLALAHDAGDPAAAAFLTTLRRILDGERDPSTLTVGLHPVANAIVTTILSHLGQGNTRTSPDAN